MKRRLLASVVCLPTALVLTAACGGDPDISTPESASEVLADAECRFRRRCCGDEAGLSESTSCEESRASRWLRFIEDSSPGKGDYPYDPDCAIPLLKLLEGDCDGAEVFLQQSFCDLGYCASGFYHGDKVEGEACAQSLECDGPLSCVDGYCQSPCGLSEGSLCADADGQQVRACRPELICNPASRVCQAPAAIGQSCADLGACVEGAYCEPELTLCRAFKQGGEACSSSFECASQSCDGTLCEAVPGAGQPCSSICAGELTCVSGLCVRLPGAGEPCLDGSLCDEGLLCEDDVCQLPGSSGEPLLCSAF